MDDVKLLKIKELEYKEVEKEPEEVEHFETGEKKHIEYGGEK